MRALPEFRGDGTLRPGVSGRQGKCREGPAHRRCSGCAPFADGCRVGELLGLQWQDVKGNRLKLRDSKTGPRTVWLGDEARAIIDGLPRLRNIPWLFWNVKFRRPIKGIDHYWHDMRNRAGLSQVCLHDLRHTFASHAAMSKETLPMIGRLLGHRNPQSTSRYAHLDDEHVLDAAEQIGAAIERMMV